MGNNLPSGVSVSDLPGCGKPNEAPRGECAVCGKPLDVADRPHKNQFCDNCDEEMLRAQLKHEERLRRERQEYWQEKYEQE